MSAYIVKTNPNDAIVEDERMFLNEPSFKKAEAYLGDEVFIWTNETSGGVGLTAIGIFEDVGSDGAATIRVGSMSHSGACLNNAILRPYRDRDDGLPLSTIAKKLYKHAHSKIAELTDEEARMVRHLIAMR